MDITRQSTFAEALAEERAIWGDHRAGQGYVAHCVSVISGDISRQARARFEMDMGNHQEIGRELANLILSCTRWVDDLGLDLDICLALAMASQRQYCEQMKHLRESNERNP